MNDITTAAVTAFHRGYTPVPLVKGGKRPAVPAWTDLTYESEQQVIDIFSDPEVGNIGIALGEPSGGLVDVDLDHHSAIRIARMVFSSPQARTPMMTGRASARDSHLWFQIEDPEHMPATRRYKLPDGTTTIEIRSTGGQTVIPPSIHPSGEQYLWEGEPWGGAEGPAEQDGRHVAARVALVALLTLIVDQWPREGSRHEAYLALAGALLRSGYDNKAEVHEFWELQIESMVNIIAEFTHDEDGGDARFRECVPTTIKRIDEGKKVAGFPTLARIIGEDHVRLIREYVREIEAMAGYASRPAETRVHGDVLRDERDDVEEQPTDGYDFDATPLDRRESTWELVDLDDYVEGRIDPVMPSILKRSDGESLFYPGRVNSLYGRSESGKTWVAMLACQEVIGTGEKVLYLDLEDEPEQTVLRMRLIGMVADDIRENFGYIHPENAVGRLQFDSYSGEPKPTVEGSANLASFERALSHFRPSLIVVDGLTVLYGLHGLDTNSASSTEHITSWMRELTDHGKRTVIMIDHTRKDAGIGATPMGSQHKLAMVQGAAIQVHPITRPIPGRMGEINLYVGKDRPGQVRAAATEDENALWGVVTIDSTVEGRVAMTVDAPNPQAIVLGGDDTDATTKALADKAQFEGELLMALQTAGSEGLALSGIKQALLANGVAVPRSDDTLRKRLNSLAAQSLAEQRGANKGSRWYAVDHAPSE